MKIRSNLSVFAIVMIALIVLAPCVLGQQKATIIIPDTNGLPNGLSIGSEQAILDGIIANATKDGLNPITLTIGFTNANGYGEERGVTGYLKLNSYAEYSVSIATNAMKIVAELKKNQHYNTNDCTVWILSSIWVNVPGDSFLALRVKKVLPVSQINSNLFLDLKPTFKQVIIPVPGLQRLEIQVESPQYTYIWEDGVGLVKALGIFPGEYTTYNLLVLNTWCLSGTNRTRVSITANGQTKVYTQSGETLTTPGIRMLDGSRVEVSMTRGTDTTVERTSDFVTWMPVATYFWSSDESPKQVLFTDPTKPNQFYRAWSR